MKLKLDENLSRHAADLIRTAGHDVATSDSQGLRGAVDEILFDVCKQESRALVTLDRDFSEVLRYPPAGSAGVVVLAMGHRPSHAALLARVRDRCPAGRTRSEDCGLRSGRGRKHSVGSA